ADRARDDLEAAHADELAELEALLAARDAEGAAELDELRAEAQALREENAALRETAAGGADDAVEEARDALAHYAALLRGVGDARRADRETWRAERCALVDRVHALELRAAHVGIARDHVARLLEITDDARKHMVGEARALYVELEDAADVVYCRMDAADELAADLHRVLTLDDYEDCAPMAAVDETAAAVRRAFVDDVVRAVDAKVVSTQVMADVNELRLMRVQGHVVEAVADISARHKLKVAELHDALDQAAGECRQAHEMAAQDRKAHDARVAELELALANAPTAAREEDSAALAAAAVAPLHAHIDALTLQLRALEDTADDFEARAEAADRRAHAYEAQTCKTLSILEQSEINMALHVEELTSLRQHVSEVEADRAIMAEKTDFQIAWLKDNFAQAYRGLELALEGSGGGHTNLGQRIKYVNALKTQILQLKKEIVECTRDRDRYGHHVRLLKSELDAYREVNEDDAAVIRDQYRHPASRLATKSRRGGAEPSEER
ncbi:hypothetical protein GGF44_001634, partial [Coemansia sp. RSA 1694]